jgi:hypothetical protein
VRNKVKLSMKAIFTILFLTSTVLNAQNKIVGIYADFFGRNLELKTDSTFDYSYRFDLHATWTQGVWSLKNDTIYFKWIPVYDTILVGSSSGEYKDSLILSLNRTAERIEPPDPHVLYSGGQNFYPYPKKLFYHRNRLYGISQEGQLNKNKTRGIWTKKKFPPWYRKVEELD